ncbi:MAG: hydroxymethylbilane synthase [Acidiferrobacterales bacterium]|nr:hydroxymethylbilane synthase [Acidiferrobacterales bacterium]
MKTLRIGTRKSQLALWQAYYVRDRLLALHDHLQVELVEIVSQGDKTLDVPLSQVGGKGLFLKELEQALLDGRTDVAVHSMKDVTVTLPEGLIIPVICPREDPSDAFVSNEFQSLDEMPENAVVGSCSLRRRCQIQAAYPHLEVRNLRGNVNTRLSRLDNGDYDALILATAGLMRLEFHDRIRQKLDTELCLPAVGQGAVGIECREGDQDTLSLIQELADEDATTQLLAERAANERLGGGCHVPIAVHAEIHGETMWVRGLVGELDGSKILRSEATGAVAEAENLGQQVAERLLHQGAQQILDAVYANS